MATVNRRLLIAACAVALAVAAALPLWQGARAADAPPPVPDNVQVPAGNRLYLIGHAVGTQDYVCLPAGDGVKFTLITPQATLFDRQEQITTHYFSPNPAEGGTIRATWQHSRDSSTVWGRVSQSSSDSAFVAPGAIPWLLVQAIGAREGPHRGDELTATTYIQRLSTSGGVAPSTGCASSTDVGRQAFVPYSADYYFYRKAS